MATILKLRFDVNTIFSEGIRRLAPLLGFEEGDGITVTACQGESNSVSFDGKEAKICYSRKHMFFRELGILCERLRTGEAFIHTDDSFFTGVSTMIDASRCAVPTVATVNGMMDYLAVMGYSMAMLYTEDLIKLENYKYFGYMRGRYTTDELRAMDDYADAYGIELIPCLECYGHMGKYLMWGEASRIKDTASVLLAREEKTFDFLDELIRTASSCFRSRRIHLGMDEAWDMGRGNFLDRHGYVPPFTIFNEFMERLIGITNKYGLQPMIWSDMYFRVSSTGNKYYDEDIVIPKEVADKIPPEVELVFWHYGEKHQCDDYMLKKHAALGRPILYAGGAWSWIGHFPEHNYTMETTAFSLNACRENGVREAMLTIWFNDNAECELFSNLFSLSYFAEMCYAPTANDAQRRARFEAISGADYNAFYEMSYYHNSFGGEKDDYSSYSHRFLGKPLFWQDIMEGLYDTHLFAKSMHGHYAACAAAMHNRINGGKWDYLYDYAYRVFDYLAVKTEIAEQLVPSYKADDRDTLAKIAGTLLPKLKEKTAAVHNIHRTIWHTEYKALGWSNLDIRYGGMASRCDTAKMQIEDYLAGRTDALESLEEVRLHKPLSGFVAYSAISSPNLKT